jgi:hypothetical protein
MSTMNVVSFDELDTRPDLIIPKKPFVKGNFKSISFETRENKTTKTDYEAIIITVVEAGTNAEAEMIFKSPKKPSEATTEKEQNTMIWKLSQLKHIFGQLSEQAITGISWSDDITYEELYTKLASFLPENYKKINCRFKFIANDNNRPQFPLFPPFISFFVTRCPNIASHSKSDWRLVMSVRSCAPISERARSLENMYG